MGSPTMSSTPLPALARMMSGWDDNRVDSPICATPAIRLQPRPTRRQTASHKTGCTRSMGVVMALSGQEPSVAANTISSIAEGPDGTMWFGTPKGVSAMSQKGWRTYTANDGLPSEDVNCLLRDSTRILWIGTAEGLAFLNDGRVHVPRGVPESLQAPIFGIEEDKNGWLWVATSDHVLHVPRDKLLSGVVKAVDVHEYDQADGLESTEGVKRSRSVVSDSAGRIWCSLSSGLSVVNPSQISDN